MMRIAHAEYMRGFNAAHNSRLTESLKGEYDTLNRILRGQLAPLRAKARQLAMNNDYVRRYINLMKTHVVGVNGVSLQVRSKDPSGKFDEEANNMIETAFYEWAKKGIASTNGKLSWIDIQRIYIHGLSCDGETVVRMVDGFDNRFGFALQPIDADLLDDTYNEILPNGNIVRMGVELDRWERPVNYYFKRSLDDVYSSSYQRHEIIPANDIVHGFMPERSTQTRGYPPIASSMLKLHNINGFAEAEVVAARISASKTFFYERKEGQDGSEFVGKRDEKGDFVQEIEPGIGEVIPDGYTIKEYAPNHPNGNFGVFNKEMLKGVAAGFGISYPTLGSDLEAVNYSSMRGGLLEERDLYKTIQGHMIETLCERVFERWLRMAILKGAVKLPFTKFDKFNVPQFTGRRWQWVDPLKDVEANKQALSAGFTTLTDILAESGKDLVETLDTLKREQDMIKEKGVRIEYLSSPMIVEEPPKESGAKGGANGKG